MPPSPPWREPNGIYHTYALNCHCSAIKLKIDISPPLFAEHAQGKTTTDAATDQQAPELFQPIECNCSVCQRHGTVGVHLDPERITFERGFETKTTYRFGAGMVEHWFCATCGCYIGADVSGRTKQAGVEKWLVNLRNLTDYDVDHLDPKKVTAGRDFEPKYQVK